MKDPSASELQHLHEVGRSGPASQIKLHTRSTVSSRKISYLFAYACSKEDELWYSLGRLM